MKDVIGAIHVVLTPKRKDPGWKQRNTRNWGASKVIIHIHLHPYCHASKGDLLGSNHMPHAR